jgi:Mg-chelatase subunit ChlD
VITKRHILFFAFCLLVSLTSFAQKTTKKKQVEPQKTRILFIVDCSYSMYGKWESDTKIKIVQNVLSNVIDSISDCKNVEIALRSFGDTKPYSAQDCQDTRLIVPFAKDNFQDVKNKLRTFVPKGSSPVSCALNEAAGDFPLTTNSRNIVVLITDGEDDCGQNVSATSQKLQKEGKFLKPFIIYISRKSEKEFATAGVLLEAHNEIEFSQWLNDVVVQCLNATTCQVDLLDSFKGANLTDVPMVFYDAQSKEEKYAFYHTFNEKGLSDTLSLDPLVNYDIKIYTLPPLTLDNVALKAGRHTNITAIASCGTMTIRYKGKDEGLQKPMNVLIKKRGEVQSINSQATGTQEKYLAGKYDLEVMSLPRLYLNDIEVKENSSTTIEIPQIGTVQIVKPEATLATLFVKDSKKGLLMVQTIGEGTKQTIGLLPGEYQIVARETNGKKATQTITKEFKIESNQITTVTLDRNNNR